MTDVSPHTNDRSIACKNGRSPAGLSLTDQTSAETITTVELDGRSPTDVWADLSSSDTFQAELVNAVLDAGQERTYLEYYDRLEKAEIDALHGSLRSLITRTANGDKSALWSLLRETEQLGKGHSGITDAVDVARLFGLALENEPDRETPTVAFVIDPEFREQRANQRREICEIVAELSQGVDVHLVGTTLSQRWLLEKHRTDLPVSRGCITTPTHGPLSEAIDRALDELNPDGRKVKILRQLADEPNGTLSRQQLENIHNVDRSRLSQVLVADENSLTNLGLVTEYESGNGRKVQLLEAGREYLSEVSQQITLNESVSGTGNSNSQTTCTPKNGKGDGWDGQFYRTAGQSRPNKEATVATGQETDVCIVKEPVELDQTEKERKSKLVEYDEDRNVATVSVRAGEGLPYLVSVATALATPWFLDDTLPNERITSLEEPAMILREARNIGWLSDRALDNPDELRNALVEWSDDLEDLSTEFHHATGDDKKALGSQLMKESHGLAGSIVHLLDAAGIDIVREIRVPKGRDVSKLENLSESIARSALIQSRYGVFAPYRHILETDSGKPLLSPEVDATDPNGSLIGSFVIRGKDVHRLKQPLEMALSSPGEFLDNLPAFSIPVSIREADRREFSLTTTRVLRSKNLRPTREAVSILHALTGSPYDVARALDQLRAEDSVRDVRPDEIRYALGTLEAERILPGQSPTVSKVVYELLQATEPLTQAELADRAGVSARSVRNNRDTLEALGIVTVDTHGWRLNLSFRTTEERRNPVVPEFVGSAFIDAVDALLETSLPPERYADPNDELGKVLFWPPNPWDLIDKPELTPLVKLAARLTGTERPDNETTISVGPEINQAAITELEAPA